MALILIAEDDFAIAAVLEEFLKKKGHHVVVAHDGATAAQKAQETRPDLIISDVHMPGLYGPTAFRSLPDAMTGKIPVIFITGLPEEQARKVTILPPAAMGRLLKKPLDLDVLASTIAELLGGRSAS